MNQKILIIDDDERNIFALAAVLKARKYACVSATGGPEGLRVLKNDPSISIALVDMMMPGMDGYELIGELKKEPATSNIPVIAVTAQAMTGDREKCLAAGADDYISKPVDVDRLVHIMSELLTGKLSGS